VSASTARWRASRQRESSSLIVTFTVTRLHGCTALAIFCSERPRENATGITPDVKISQTFDRRVDRDVPIAIYGLKHRTGTARSTLPDRPEPFRH
jgi:hypothetical protein